MAPNLAASTLQLIHDMILSNDLTVSKMAEAACCSERTIRRIRSNMRLFGGVKVPPNKGGRPRSLTPVMVKALCDHLFEKPHLYLDEMAHFLWEEFETEITLCSISRVLKYEGWLKKKAKQKAWERNTNLCNDYFHLISNYHSYQFVFVDESGCDKQIGARRTGWSPLSISPVQVTKFHRNKRYHILPAYTQDGILFSCIFQGSTDASLFEDFIEELLCHCGKYPGPNSVLVMDNASFHHSDRIKQLCSQARVQLVYLPPYSPDLNPIEEFFSELKAFIRRHWQSYEEHPTQGFGFFLEWCIDTVGAREQSAEGHFRNCGLAIERM